MSATAALVTEACICVRSVGVPAFSPERGDSVRDGCASLVHRQHFDNAQAFAVISNFYFRERNSSRVPHEQVNAEVAKRFAQRDGRQTAMPTMCDSFTSRGDVSPRTFANVQRKT